MVTFANRALEPKLFSSWGESGQSSNIKRSDSREQDTPRPSQYILPQNLDAALRQLSDADIDKLAEAALEERIRRKGPLAREGSHRKQPDETKSPHIPQGKVNAVRAAFKAGITLNRIAREFGLSKTDVQRALAADDKK